MILGILCDSARTFGVFVISPCFYEKFMRFLKYEARRILRQGYLSAVRKQVRVAKRVASKILTRNSFVQFYVSVSVCERR